MAKSSEPDYLAIAKKKVHRPSKNDNKPRKVLVYGKNKKGKTWFGLSAGIEKTLVIDPEEGTDLMVERRPYVWNVDRWQDMQDVWGALRTGELSPAMLGQGKSKEPFTYLVVDGLTRLHDMAHKYYQGQLEKADLTKRPGNTLRKDYGGSGKLLNEMMVNFHSLPMGVIYTAQERMISLNAENSPEQEDDPDNQEVDYFYVANLPAAPRSMVYSLVDVIARIYTVRVPVPDSLEGEMRAQRRLQIGIHEKYDTGYRSEFVLPDIIKKPTMPKLEKLMKAGEL